MRSAAAHIAGIPPPIKSASRRPRPSPGGDKVSPPWTTPSARVSSANPELPAIARILPSDAICRHSSHRRPQHTATTSRVTAATANTVAQDSQCPKDPAVRQIHQQRQVDRASPAPLASHGFPGPPAIKCIRERCDDNRPTQDIGRSPLGSASANPAAGVNRALVCIDRSQVEPEPARIRPSRQRPYRCSTRAKRSGVAFS